MIENTITRLTWLCDMIPALLRQISAEEFSLKPIPGEWSKKQVIGHLIDSATNNHQRFIRAQFEDTPFIIYDQNKWNDCSRYQDMSSEHVISFWEAYNRHLLEVIKRIPSDDLSRLCNTNESQPVTLLWLIEDYVAHMEHHLHEVASY